MSNVQDDIIKLLKESRKPLVNYYGLKYGTFHWVRGIIDIYDHDDINYIEKCLKKIRSRLDKEKNGEKHEREK